MMFQISLHENNLMLIIRHFVAIIYGITKLTVESSCLADKGSVLEDEICLINNNNAIPPHQNHTVSLA